MSVFIKRVLREHTYEMKVSNAAGPLCNSLAHLSVI